ncbi:MAG: phenylalanine--tRNA ligase subunit beta [Acidobacteriales bacterium]|nr:phenylalanine--tRNA ligase subunit beta [Candidatus Koribacter versatilis]MBI3646355.1 phenylalanine--tRNA ligase subunit beta [Terriglobales bacterium]
MKISPHWLRDFVDLPVDYRRLADELTLAGIAVEGISGERENTVFEMEITTNRPDAMNHYGVAREVSALYDLPLRPIEAKLPAAKGKSDVTIEIQDPELCPRFTAQEIRNATIKASPTKIANRLALLDQRPISNAVDATNYVLWESGKPTHVFDLDLLEGRKLVIRRAADGETLKTLDGVDRQLTTEDLVVADAKKPVGLAGVMGGYDAMITEQTRNILIESAWWDPVTVRRMSKRHGLHTDASHRFERGADFESTVLSTNRVAQLILESGGGELIGSVIDVIARKLDLAPIELDRREVRRILGEELSDLEISRILTRLGFVLLSGPEGGYLVHIPSWRLDIEREIDLIEEIARLHGYDKFANTLPACTGGVIDQPDAAKDSRLRSSLLALGYNEGISLTFVSKDDAKRFSAAPEIDLANPISDEASVMRTSMLPGMLNMLAYNLNRGTDNVRLFEAGNVFEAAGAKTVELKRLCVGATGKAAEGGAHQPARPLSFFDLKGDVEDLLAAFTSWTLYYDANTADYYHPGRSARAVMDGTTVAQFGQLHPDVAAARKLRQDVFVGEIFLDRLYQHDLRQVRYEALPRFPGVERDFSFVFGDAVVFEKIRQSVVGLGIAELQSFIPVEIFRGEKVGVGEYSILVRAKFQSAERTLRDDEVAKWCRQIGRALESLGGVQRV